MSGKPESPLTSATKRLRVLRAENQSAERKAEGKKYTQSETLEAMKVRSPHTRACAPCPARPACTRSLPCPASPRPAPPRPPLTPPSPPLAAQALIAEGTDSDLAHKAHRSVLKSMKK